MPWIQFFLRALQQQKARFEIKIEREKLLLGQLPELSIAILELTKARGRATISEIVFLTKANRNTVIKNTWRVSFLPSIYNNMVLAWLLVFYIV